MAKRSVKIGKPNFLTMTVTVDDQNVKLKLDKYAQRLKSFRRFWTEFFAPQFFKDIQNNIVGQGRYVGGWRALSPRYAAWKLKHFGPLPILVRSGTMAESLEVGGRHNVIRAFDDHGIFGSLVPWLAYHQRGTRRMPKRQVIWIGPSRVYQRLLQQYTFEEGLRVGLPMRKVG